MQSGLYVVSPQDATRFLDKVEQIMLVENAELGAEKFGIRIWRGVFSKGAELEKAGQLYESLAKELLALPVPATLSELHLAFTNNTAIIGAILLSISEVNTDPISAMVSFSEYSNRSTAFVSGLENIVTKLEQDGIIK
jgi:hypothetical protein